MTQFRCCCTTCALWPSSIPESLTQFGPAISENTGPTIQDCLPLFTLSTDASTAGQKQVFCRREREGNEPFLLPMPSQCPAQSMPSQCPLNIILGLLVKRMKCTLYLIILLSLSGTNVAIQEDIANGKYTQLECCDSMIVILHKRNM